MAWTKSTAGHWGASDSDLACPTWEAEMLAGAVPASQALADRLIADGHAGMRVRSYAAGSSADDLNLVMWRWGPHRPDRVVLVDDEGRLAAPTISGVKRS